MAAVPVAVSEVQTVSAGGAVLMKTKSPLPWFGSDAGVAAELARLLDHCRHVTIPFAGGLSILPHLKARAVVVNDLHTDAINFYLALSGEFGFTAKHELIQRCARTLSHPIELERAESIINSETESGSARAWAFWALCWLGRKGQGGTSKQGGKTSVRRTANGGTNASRVRAAAGDLDAWANEFERCEFEMDDFRAQLNSVAKKRDCGVYVDPPWVKEGNRYLHPFSENDHRDLARILTAIETATVVVRYGDDPLVRNLYRKSDGWNWIEAKSRTQANVVRGEVWLVRNSTEVSNEI